ncbi:dihydrodipicolinate synthase family protein [Salinicola peritrichatus]|uniref:dihydrodipicolinate synthase family protein n=1 Tax=Salinicola peritrichatus TaxID=1267424 RepID=UPI001EF94BF9|nr:dihydrodipicolinate synthase family protein [Salinicola peritrichatus]
MPQLLSTWAPVVTPFDSDLTPDSERFLSHCRWLLDNGVGLAIFGTNSEANSMSVAEKMQLLDCLGEANLPRECMMPGTGSCAIPDAVALTRHAMGVGINNVLMLPPFYYKGVSEEGLYGYFSEIVERVGSDALRIFLYHIPPVSQVPISVSLIERLLKAYPDNIAGIKDSSGDWSNTRAVIDAFAGTGFRVYAGSERFLLPTLRAGGSGCISATANVNPKAISELAARWQQDDADERQAALNDIRDILESVPVIPALKEIIAHHRNDDVWKILRPPLVNLAEKQRQSLMEALKASGFSM